jgi:tRNA threonylcarbamoyladenosine biosynthesis protein TsaB
MAYILHIDTSSDYGFVAIGQNGNLIAFKNNNDKRNHAAILNNDINEVIRQAGIKLNELSAIAVCGGPGSYTGLRISLASAKSICYALDKPLIIHNRLLLLALDSCYKYLSAYDNYVSILQARDNEYFVSVYGSKLNAIIAPKHIFADELSIVLKSLTGKILTIGNIPSFFLHSFSPDSIDFIEKHEIEATAWMKYGFEQYNCNDFVNLSAAEPFYLKQVYTHNQKKIK